MPAPPQPNGTERYRKIEQIGHGNFGVVYKGLDTKKNKVIAIKTLDLDSVNEDVASVQQEVALLAHLSEAKSSNVIKYYESVLVGSKLWIIMDLCSGGSVRTLIKAGPLTDLQTSVLFREITVAVAAIHSQGIIHRDIKAANVLITMAGHVKLCDFGVAAQSTTQGNKEKRMTVVGTPYWMAPEVITEGKGYDSKADIWSLGISVYETVTGKPPYADKEAMRALILITSSRPPRLEGPSYSPLLKEFVALCLDEDPDERPTANDLLKHKYLTTNQKVPATILKELVDRYMTWKKKNRHHRDSLSTFNPHKSQEDGKSDNEPDAGSDFDFDDTDINFDNTVPNISGIEDETIRGDMDVALTDAPNSLREIFGVPPKLEEEKSDSEDFVETPTRPPLPPIPNLESDISTLTTPHHSQQPSQQSSQPSAQQAAQQAQQVQQAAYPLQQTLQTQMPISHTPTHSGTPHSLHLDPLSIHPPTQQSQTPTNTSHPLPPHMDRARAASEIRPGDIREATTHRTEPRTPFPTNPAFTSMTSTAKPENSRSRSVSIASQNSNNNSGSNSYLKSSEMKRLHRTNTNTATTPTHPPSAGLSINLNAQTPLATAQSHLITQAQPSQPNPMQQPSAPLSLNTSFNQQNPYFAFPSSGLAESDSELVSATPTGPASSTQEEYRFFDSSASPNSRSASPSVSLPSSPKQLSASQPRTKRPPVFKNGIFKMEPSEFPDAPVVDLNMFLESVQEDKCQPHLLGIMTDLKQALSSVFDALNE